MAVVEQAPKPVEEENAHDAAYEIVAGYINEVLDNGDFVPAKEAMRICALMQKEHAMAHLAFLDGEAYRVYYDKLKQALEFRRKAARNGVARRAFHKSVSENDTEALSVFQNWRMKVDDDETQRGVGDMSGKDHLYVADGYKASKEENAMLEAFHRAVAKKVGNKKTSEVFTEPEFLALYESITKR